MLKLEGSRGARSEGNDRKKVEGRKREGGGAVDGMYVNEAGMSKEQ